MCTLAHTGGLAGWVHRAAPAAIAHQLEVPYIECVKNLPVRTRLRKTMTCLGDRFSKSDLGMKVARQPHDGEILDVLGGTGSRLFARAV